MKTLFLIIAIAGCAYGQGDFPDGKWTRLNRGIYSTDTLKYYIVNPIYFVDTIPPMKTPITMYRRIADAYDLYVASLREEFERERGDLLNQFKFAQSIEIRNTHKDTIEVSYLAYGFIYGHVIIHKRPTLEGFMDYLRSK